MFGAYSWEVCSFLQDKWERSEPGGEERGGEGMGGRMGGM